MSKKSEEIRVVSRNSFSKLRLAQIVLVLLLFIGIIGTINNGHQAFILMAVIGFVGLFLTRLLRWLHRD